MLSVLSIGTGLVCLTAYGASFAQPPAAEPAPPVVPPPWPSTKIADIPFPVDFGTEALMARMDEVPGDEVVLLSPGEKGGAVATVLTWEKTGVEVQSVAAVGKRWPNAVTADRNGDGRAEIYALGPQNQIIQLRLEKGELRKALLPSPGPWTINSLVFTGLQGAAEPELILAVNTRGKWDSTSDAPCNMLAGFRWASGTWKKVWQQPVVQLARSLELLWGDYHPGPGAELIVGHQPSDVSDAVYEVFSWQGRGLAKRTSFFSTAMTAHGLQHWVCASPNLGGVSPAVLSLTFRLPPKAAEEEPPPVGQVLRWDARRPLPAYRLPGRPVACGDLRGVGTQGVITVDEDGKCSFYEPRPVAEQPHDEGQRSQ